MKKFSYVILLSLIFCTSCIREEDVKEKVKTGSLLPSFTVTSVDGETFSSSALEAKVGLIVFFDTTCPDCIRELPKANALWNELKDEHDFILLPIARDEKTDIINQFWKDQLFTMPAYYDTSRKAYNQFANKVIPRFYLVDRKGIVQWMGVEKITDTTAQLKQRIDALLLEK